MDLKLTRIDFLATGIFGCLENYDESLCLETIEHAYQVTEAITSSSTFWSAKVPPGQYTCVRGIHKLLQGNAFETFEITNVPGHTGVLFHLGNTEDDSEGCVLLGLFRIDNMIMKSRLAFEKFMECQTGCDSFILNIS